MNSNFPHFRGYLTMLYTAGQLTGREMLRQWYAHNEKHGYPAQGEY